MRKRNGRFTNNTTNSPAANGSLRRRSGSGSNFEADNLVFQVSNRLSARDLWRNLDQPLGEEHGDRIELASMRSQAESLRFERNQTTAAEWVEHRRRISIA